MTATLTIQADEREALHELLLRRLTILAEHDCKLAEREGVTVKQLYESFGDDLRPFDEVGLGFLIELSALLVGEELDPMRACVVMSSAHVPWPERPSADQASDNSVTEASGKK